VGTESQVETQLEELKSEMLSYRGQTRLRKKWRLKVIFSFRPGGHGEEVKKNVFITP
jgi:hypothetical protein